MKPMELRERAGRVVLGAAVGLGVAVSVTACGGSSGGSSSGPAPSSSEALTRAADASSAASGYKMAMTMHETVDGKNIAVQGSGSVSPGTHSVAMNMQMNTGAAGALGNLKLKVVLAKDTIYMKLPSELTSEIPGGKPWVSINLAKAAKLDGISGLGTLINSSSSFSNPGQYLDYLRATAAGSVKNLGQATVNGVQTTHYHADVDFTKLPNALPKADRPAIRKLITQLDKQAKTGKIPLNVWIDGSHMIRRLQVAYNVKLTAGQSAKIALTENILSYGTQPAPTIPSSSQTTNLLALISH
jgi:hypothetical protein